jgi:hypothetical protein
VLKAAGSSNLLTQKAQGWAIAISIKPAQKLEALIMSLLRVNIQTLKQ